MNGILFHVNGDSCDAASGEVKKVHMQLNAFRKKNIEIRLVTVMQSTGIYKIIRRLPFIPTHGFRLEEKLLKADIYAVDFLYIRKYIFDLQFIRVLKKIKFINPKLKIIIEIPTYPYDQEWGRLIDKPLIIKEQLSRNKLRKYVDRFVTSSTDDNEVFGVKTIKIQNGIDVNEIVIKNNSNKMNNTINCLGVALLAFWHGYDRMINGLYEYYQKQDIGQTVIFHIVGDGTELGRLKKIVSNKGLEKYVIFHGKKHGAELDEIFDVCDVAIGSLGIHRLGLKKVSTLKAKEYCAKGIPFIKSYGEDSFDNCNFEYCLDFSGDEKNIDIDKIVKFYRTLEAKYTRQGISNNMRLFAEAYLTWEKELQPVIDYLEM